MAHVELVGDGRDDPVLEKVEGGLHPDVQSCVILAEDGKKWPFVGSIGAGSAFDLEMGLDVGEGISIPDEGSEVGRFPVDGKDGSTFGIKLLVEDVLVVDFQEVAEGLPGGAEYDFHLRRLEGTVEFVWLVERVMRLIVVEKGLVDDPATKGVHGHEEIGLTGAVRAEEGEDGDAAEFGARSRQERKAGLGGMPVGGFSFGEGEVDGFVENRPEVFDVDELDHGVFDLIFAR